MRPIEEGLRGKSVLITGGTYGIAKSIVDAFCYAGCSVMFGARSEEKGHKIAREFSEKYGVQCEFFRCDVTDHLQIKALVEHTVARFGKLDVLVNCAGVWPLQHPVDEVTVEDFVSMLNLNLVSYFAASKYALPYLRTTCGNIVNIGSVTAGTGKEGASLYTASKGGITSLTKTLAIDEARNGVRVNEIKPGHIQNEQYFDAMNALSPEEGAAFAHLHSRLQWLGRGGKTEEVASAVLFMASEWASFITGATLMVSGGYDIGEGIKEPMQHWETMEKK